MKRVAMLMMLILLLAACGGSDESGSFTRTEGAAAPAEDMAFEPEMEVAEEMAAEFDGDAAADLYDEAAGAGSSVAQGQAPSDRKIIYTANMTLRVDDPRLTAREIQGMVAGFGGYVAQANVFETGQEQYQASIQLRVPAGQFDSLLSALRGLSTEVINESLGTQDVTEQFVDVQARIENLERTEEELQILLTEARENQGKTEDILRVYRELTDIRGQIERLQGQLNVLSDRVDLATINVELIPPQLQVQILNQEWSFARVVRESVRDLTSGLQAMVDTGTRFTIAVLPLLLLFVAFAALVIRGLRWFVLRITGRSEARADAAPPPPPPSTPPPTAPPPPPAEA